MDQSPPTQEDRSLALLAHVLQLFAGFVGPLVIFLVKREQSRFVAFHALQVLLWQVVWLGISTVVGFLYAVAMFGAFFVGVAQAQNGPPWAFFAIWPAMMLGWGALWVLDLLLVLLYGIRAGNGEWAQYPVVGAWALRCLR